MSETPKRADPPDDLIEAVIQAMLRSKDTHGSLNAKPREMAIAAIQAADDWHAGKPRPRKNPRA